MQWQTRQTSRTAASCSGEERPCPSKKHPANDVVCCGSATSLCSMLSRSDSRATFPFRSFHSAFDNQQSPASGAAQKQCRSAARSAAILLEAYTTHCSAHSENYHQSIALACHPVWNSALPRHLVLVRCHTVEHVASFSVILRVFSFV